MPRELYEFVIQHRTSDTVHSAKFYLDQSGAMSALLKFPIPNPSECFAFVRAVDVELNHGEEQLLETNRWITKVIIASLRQ